jgi:hypothetical protein
MKQPNESLEYAQMGMAAMLPGMVHMLELMQQQVDDFRTRLAALQGQAAMQGSSRPARNGRLASGWPADPEERSREMKRRMKVSKSNNSKPSALSVERKKAWEALSPAKKKKRLAAMLAGRKAKVTPVVQLEKAS